MWLLEGLRNKFNKVQETISVQEGSDINDRYVPITVLDSFNKIDSVRRGASLIIDACSSLDFDIKKSTNTIKLKVRDKALNTLLNYRPNPYQSVLDFRKGLYTDYIFHGHAFIYFDGAFLYHLPASSVTILTDPITFIKGYSYSGSEKKFTADEVFSFKDVNNASIYRGSSRLEGAKESIEIIYNMQNVQKGFFKNGAVFGLFLTSDNPMSAKAKERTIDHWVQYYNPTKGTRRPVILDNGLKPFTGVQTSFKDMDFDAAMTRHNAKILQALGVPPILLDGGNNANISPNLRLFYLETVLPIVRNFNSALERYFGYDIEPITTGISALDPDLKEVASYHSTLVNSGILAPNEAREELRYEKLEGHDDLRIPANIAGSASNPSEGGRPTEDNEENQ